MTDSTADELARLDTALPEFFTAIGIAAPGGPDVLQPVTERLKAPAPGEVLIEVAAAGVNGPDLAQRRGHYDPPPCASALPGLEVSGTIVALGDGVTGFSLGDRVMALTNGGGYAEYVAVPFGQVLPAPLGWSLVEAAALPETLFTITQQLVMRAGLAPGMSVLIHGASGGIGGTAILVCRAIGADAIAVVSSPEKADYVRRLGASAVIDRKSEDIVARTLALTGGRGADRIIDLVGGPMAAQNIAASARFGHIVLVSTLGGGDAQLPLRMMMMKQLTLSGSTLRPQDAATKAAIAETIRLRLYEHLIATDCARPAVARFDLAEAPAAHRRLESGDSFGKIVLVTSRGAALDDQTDCA
jgi:NADPH2:quinone reductase